MSSSSVSSLPKEAEVSRMLEGLKREPVDTQGSQDALLAPIYTLLMSAPPNEDDILHWFCDKARPVVVEASIFLLRLHAYSANIRVDSWKAKMRGVLHGCCGCVQGYANAKVSSRDTYFAAFSKPVLDSFFSTIDKWELSIVLDAIKSAGISPGSKKTFSDLPTAVLYHILSAVPLFESSELLHLIEEHPPAFISLGWPVELPPGLLLLLFNEKREIRTWAHQQMVGCSSIDKDKFLGSYELVFQSITAALTSGARTPSLQADVNHTAHRPLRKYFTMSPSALWSGLQSFLRVLPSTLTKSENSTGRAFRHAIIGHLHDKGSHFPDVLRAFVFLIKKHGKFLWQGEDYDFPQVVFDSIKDNSMYLRLIQDSDSNPIQQPWFVQWFQVYLNSLNDTPIFGDILRKIVGFACEELQHERFKDKRPSILASTLTTLYEVLQPAEANNKNKTLFAVTHVLDIHADVIVNVAFSPLKNTRPWQSARAAGRRLLGHALGFDASHVEAIIFQISDVVQQQTSSSGDKRKHDLKEPIFRTQIWKKMYETIGGNDSEGLTLLISLVARSAHLDTLSSDAFNPAGLPTEIRKNIASIIVAVNAGLHSMRAGFLDAITQYTNATSSTAPVVRSLLCRQDMAKHVLALLLSPVEELQMASQILLGQAFDVDLRSDCLRAMLKDLPVPTLNGIATAVSTFNDCAPLFPDACNIAKSLVRCMTDVIEVLTNGRDGLLFDGQFVGVSEGDRPQMRLPKLWRLMCGAITIIFRRTPTWSKVNEPDAMIDWMRDALIFARDLVAQRRTFEAAVLLLSQQSETTMASPRKPSQIGHNMLNDLQPVLTESIRWLRLTDMELLHQSSNLVQTLMDCFRETGVRPSQDSLAKLEKFLDTSRRKSIPQNLQTRLSETHLSELATALSFFSQEDDDDEIQYIGESKPSFSHGSTSARAENSRIQDSKLRQRKMDDFMATTSKPPGKTPSSLGLKPFVEIRRAVKPATHPNSLMAQVRSQVAAQGKVTVAGGSRLVHKPEASSKFSHGRPTLKDETRSTKPGISQSSSSASSASEDEAGGGGLASLGKLQKSPLVKKPAYRRTVKLMDTHFTGRNSALDRIHKREEAQRAALRMKPDLQPLHHAILSWNYDHEGPEPQMLGDRSSYMTVMDQFESDQEYQRTFEPLLILECWSQLIKSKEEAVPETLTCKVTSRQYMNKWLDLDVSVTDRPPDRWRLAETDIVLLRESGGKNSTLAKVQSSNSNPFQIQATLRCLVNFNAADPGLSINTQLRLTKVFSLSTIAREYAALKALPYYDFHHQVMRPRPADIPQLPAAQIEQAMKAYQVNEPQAIAILGSMRTDGFSLVQGPPGTGKTWTICGIAGAFLSARPRPATVVHVGRNFPPSEKIPPLKMLVCAPSNAAIDEVAKRLKDGVRNSDGRLIVPNVVRVGSEAVINISVKDISLDQLVDQRLNSDPKQANATSSSASATLASLRAEMDALRNSRALKMQEMTALKDNTSGLQALELELTSLNNKRMSLSQQLNRIKDQQKSDSRTLDAARRKYRAEVLMDADIICSTLSGAGHEVLENLNFEMVVIDEAAQSVELSSLIPLKFKLKRCIMVGDPQQLPPTVLSPLANKFGYGQSLFVRLQKNKPEAVHLLSIQYRMHPDISRLPSTLFYGQRLLDGPEMAKKTSQIWHKHTLFGTYKFVNVASGSQRQVHSGHSLVNHTECEVAVAIYNRLKTEYPDTDLDFRIGVITMYRAQLLELKRRFKASFGADVIGKVDFNTVDGFQGQEKDIIILSCVRAGPGVQSIGFLADQRRLNVAITRARSSLFILGHAATLERSDQMWKVIVEDARNTSRMLDADPLTYRRPVNSSTIPRSAVKPVMPRHVVSIPSDLKTPREMVQSKPHSSSVDPGPSNAPLIPSDLKTPREIVQSKPHSALSSVDPGPSNAPSVGDDSTKRSKPILSIVLKKRRNSDDADTQRPPPSLRDIDEIQAKPPKPHPPFPRKRPKEVTMFIPKKKPDLKREAPDHGDPSQGDTKRRIIDKRYE